MCCFDTHDWTIFPMSYAGFPASIQRHSNGATEDIINTLVPVAKVYSNSFWMLHHGSQSAKRTVVWSNVWYMIGELAYA